MLIENLFNFLKDCYFKVLNNLHAFIKITVQPPFIVKAIYYNPGQSKNKTKSFENDYVKKKVRFFLPVL